MLWKIVRRLFRQSVLLSFRGMDVCVPDHYIWLAVAVARC